MEKNNISPDKHDDDDDVNAPDNKKILEDLEKQDEITVKLNVPSVFRPKFLLRAPKRFSASLRQAILSVSNLRVIVISIAITYLVSSEAKKNCICWKSLKMPLKSSIRSQTQTTYIQILLIIHTDNLMYCAVYVELSIDANLSCI